ncbi:MAG: hypothetical protein ACRDHX_09205 [Chloroflexota bacterium]
MTATAGGMDEVEGVRAAREQVDDLHGQLSTTRTELAQVEGRAHVALQEENVREIGQLWETKHRLAQQLRELVQACAGAQQHLEQSLQAALGELVGRAAHDAADLRQEHDAAVSELSAALARAAELVQWLQTAPAAWESHQSAWQAEVARLLVSAGTAAAGSHFEVLAGQPAAVPADPAWEPPSVPDDPDGAPAQRQWSVYDPDKGKMVETADELLRLLARWYPQKTRQERIDEFAHLSHAEAMPPTLRQELRRSGLQLADDSRSRPEQPSEAPALPPFTG